MKSLLRLFFRGLLSPVSYYRLARFLWLDSRRDPTNDMASNGEFELQSKIIKQIAGPAVILDIGANIGKYCKSLLDKSQAEGVADALKIFCFEPNPKCVEKIEAVIAETTSSAHVSVVDRIVTNEKGQMSFFIKGDLAGSSSLKIDTKSEAAKEVICECTTFDDFCAEENLDEILFVKIDTEGNDMRVLEGARKWLSAGKIKYIQFEYNYRWIYFRNYLKDVFDLVEPYGYRIAKVTPDGLEVYASWDYELEVYREGNYLIAKEFDSLGLPILTSPIFSSK